MCCNDGINRPYVLAILIVVGYDRRKWRHRYMNGKAGTRAFATAYFLRCPCCLVAGHRGIDRRCRNRIARRTCGGGVPPNYGPGVETSYCKGHKSLTLAIRGRIRYYRWSRFFYDRQQMCKPCLCNQKMMWPPRYKFATGR